VSGKRQTGSRDGKPDLATDRWKARPTDRWKARPTDRWKVALAQRRQPRPGGHWKVDLAEPASDICRLVRRGQINRANPRATSHRGKIDFTAALPCASRRRQIDLRKLRPALPHACG
jgi:hypothetical protein